MHIFLFQFLESIERIVQFLLVLFLLQKQTLLALLHNIFDNIYLYLRWHETNLTANSTTI